MTENIFNSISTPPYSCCLDFAVLWLWQWWGSANVSWVCDSHQAQYKYPLHLTSQTFLHAAQPPIGQDLQRKSWHWSGHPDLVWVTRQETHSWNACLKRDGAGTGEQQEPEPELGARCRSRGEIQIVKCKILQSTLSSDPESLRILTGICGPVLIVLLNKQTQTTRCLYDQNKVPRVFASRVSFNYFRIEIQVLRKTLFD